VTITCSWCGDHFDRSPQKGRIPKYCSATCRQRAYEARRTVCAADQVGQAWKAELGTVLDQLPALANVQQMIANSMPKLDLASLMPSLGVAPLLADETMRALSQATATTRVLDQLPALANVQQMIANSMPKLDLASLMPSLGVAPLLADETMRALSQATATTRVLDQLPALANVQQMIANSMPKLDLASLMPSLGVAPLLADELLEELRGGALRLAAALPLVVRDDVHSLLPQLAGDRGDSTAAADEGQILLLLLGVFGWITALNPEAAVLLAKVLASMVESGVVMADLIGQAYSALSERAPDDRLLSWALALAFLLGWVQKRREGQE
jgi:hypothetical protein